MTGRVIARPEQQHSCSPGWTYSTAKASSSPIGPPPGSRLAHPPTAYDYPAGTVWQCDDCGQAWVSTGPPNDHSPGMVEFRPEHRRERRRRERAG